MEGEIIQKAKLTNIHEKKCEKCTLRFPKTRARAMPPSLVWSWAAKKPRAPTSGAATLRAHEALPRIAVLVM